MESLRTLRSNFTFALTSNFSSRVWKHKLPRIPYVPNYPASISLTLRNAGKLIISLFPPLLFFRALSRGIHMHTFDKLIILGRLYSEKKIILWSRMRVSSQAQRTGNWCNMQSHIHKHAIHKQKKIQRKMTKNLFIFVLVKTQLYLLISKSLCLVFCMQYL